MACAAATAVGEWFASYGTAAEGATAVGATEGAGVVGASYGEAAAGSAAASGAGAGAGALGTAVAGAATSAAVSSLLMPRPGQPNVAPVTRMPDALSQQAARQKAIIDQFARRGRASTILTDAGTDKLGG